MPGARLRTRPSSATESDEASDEASQLERHLQQQLQDDIARIFDESIYSDLEVVCGKLKILTHSCILKARTNRFYRKLETILHVNIGRNSYDEIYSFISDAYTECNIKLQEQGIITYLDKNLNILKTFAHTSYSNHEDISETDVFLTPKGVTPYIEKSFLKSISHSPSTELTKEYYALVPIDGNLLDKELIEQDALSNAFQTIIDTQSDDLSKIHLTRNKPTSLSLRTSHSSKTIKHSSSCDILTKFHLKETKEVSVHDSKATESVTASGSNNTNNTVDTNKSDNAQFVVDKGIDSACSPDSLITDDPSSSSDYLSAAYTCSPGAVSSGCFVQLNVGDKTSKMENIFPSSDSGLENTCLLESLNSHKDVTITDVSLTESTLHDLIDDAHSSLDSTVSPLPENKENIQRFKNIASSTAVCGGTISDKSIDVQKIKTSKYKESINNIRSSKEEKQRQNEEIVILESSSLSSETGSWESVFPPKLTEKEACENFINNERKYSTKDAKNKSVESDNLNEDLCPSLVQKSPFKTTSCFIDASSLVDEEDNLIKVEDDAMVSDENRGTLPPSSHPVPCTSSKVDKGQNDWSESNDDSLEQTDNKDPDSIQKDLSPTIFEMTPITEDSLCFENAVQVETENKSDTKYLGNSATSNLEQSLSSSTIYASSTPHNSIMSLPSATLDQFKSEGSESDTTVVGRETYPNTKFQKKYDESSPIISGGASVEDHLPQITNTGSLLTRRKIENIPIVSGAYIHKDDEKCNRKSPKPSCAPVWVVDMSSSPKSDSDRSLPNINSDDEKKLYDKPYDKIEKTSKNYNSDNCNKSRSSVDSDNSERLSQKFYIDLSSLPDPSPSKNKVISENVTEKKNIFSMYIDISEKSAVKDMPSRLSSSSNAKRNCSDETKMSPKPSIQNDLDCPPASTLISNDATNTFETYETLCNDPNISISEIIRIPERTKPKKQTKEVDTGQKGKWFQGNEYQETVRDIKKTVIHEEPTSKLPKNDLFVKLSDLDKPCQKTEISVSLNDKKVLDVRMTRSIPDNTWRDQSPTVTSSMSSKFVSSFHSENALSLNRLFPHLKNEFSRSMPGSLSSRTRSPRRPTLSSSPGEVDEQASDNMSEVSSMQSSMCRSVIENSTTEETSQSSSPVGNCQSRLGQDLLRMFIEEIAPDVIVEVSGRRIKAHKCILSSRCQYFAGILSGGWVESAGNVIILPPFSFNVVHFALCHIYSGVSTIPDSISIVELATIADMLGLEGLKEAIMFTLKTKYCHHFHRPCSVCTAGVLECFPLSSVYGLDDLYRKCLKWITKYFHKVWPTKAFATLPKDLLDKCFRQVIINLTTENFVDTVSGCAFTVAALNSSRWADVVARLCRRLLDAAGNFAAAHLAAVLRALAAVPHEPAPSAPSAPSAPPAPPAHAARALLECIACAIEWAPPDEACAAYAYLTDVVANRNQTNKQLDGDAAPEPLTFLAAHAAEWRLQCEGALLKAAPRAVATQAFKNLPPDLRRRLREFGCVVYDARAVPAPQPPLKVKSSCRNYHSRNGKPPATAATAAGRCSDIDHVRASFVPYSPKPVIPESVGDVKKSQRAAAPLKIRTTRAQEERAKYNMTKKQTSQERLSVVTSKVQVRHHQSFEKTKPRYLEPRAVKEAERRPATVAPKKKLPMAAMWSSSESSRNSSPVQVGRAPPRGARGARGGARSVSQDSLGAGSRPRTADPSSDSLADSQPQPQPANIYATYTKNKPTKEHNLKPPNCPKPTSRSNKTKIPVYLNPMRQSAESRKLLTTANKNCEQSDKSATVNRSQNRTNERKVPCSLMNATKSSSAKMVPKVVKEPHSSKSPSKRVNGQPKHGRQPETDQGSQDLPLMERSGTFLKDEPTFGDKTTLIDID